MALLFVLQMEMEEKPIRNAAKAEKVYSLPWLGLYTASMPVLAAAAAAAAQFSDCCLKLLLGGS